MKNIIVTNDFEYAKIYHKKKKSYHPLGVGRDLFIFNRNEFPARRIKLEVLHSCFDSKIWTPPTKWKRTYLILEVKTYKMVDLQLLLFSGFFKNMK